MQRNFLRGLLICLIPCLIAGFFAVRGPYKLGIDLAGGTILVYEVDVDKTKARQELDKGRDPIDPDTGVSADGIDMQRLAEALKKRIDPSDLMNVIIRPVTGANRVEIIMPYGGGRGGEANTEDSVQRVKNDVAQAGVLEFRILANVTDDAEAVADAEAAVAALSPEDQLKRATAGQPPPAPTRKYSVEINGVKEDNVAYAWVEMGPEERKTMGLNNSSKDEAERGGLWRQLAEQRGKTVRHGSGGEGGRSGSMLLFSRDVKDEQYLAKEDAEIRKAEAAGRPHRGRKLVQYYVLSRVSPLDSLRVGGEITLTAFPTQDQGLNQAIGFRFNGAGAREFGAITERNKPSAQLVRHLAVILDNEVVSAASLNAVIRDQGIISGPPGSGFDQDYVNRIVRILRSGALSADLKPNPVSENTVGPTLGRDTITRGLRSVVLAFGAVMLFMLWYYRFAGAVACIALLANLLLTVGFMVMMNAAFTLAGLAGLVLMLGMAVDANVLIYERLREEREKGATLAAAIRNGYDRAFPTIIDTHLTSIVTAIVLFAFGNDNLKGFAVSLTVGLIISLFTSLYMTRLIFDYGLKIGRITELRMHRLFARPNFNPMKYRFQLFTATSILTVLGLGLFLVRGEKGLNVDFTKGTVFGARLTKPLPMSGSSAEPGLLDLLDEDRQQQVLKLKSVADGGVVAVKDAPAADAPTDATPDAARAASSQYTYRLTYESGPPVLVALANAPEGGNEAEQLENVRARAGQLPDVSVEQVYVSALGDGDLPTGQARSFNIRTTEREKELVQVALERLLRDQSGNSLLPTPQMATDSVTGATAEVTFGEPVTVGMVEQALTREFRAANRMPPAGPAFELTPVPSADGTPARDLEVRAKKFTRMRLDVSKNIEFRGLRDAAAAGKAAAVVGGLAAADARAVDDEASLRGILARTATTLASQPVADRVETFDPALAADTRAKALYAILASWVAILLYLWFRFGSWTFGLAAVLCLVHDLCFTLGAIAACHYLYDLPLLGSVLLLHDFKIDLAAVAALLTLVGYSVNDTIVVFDRIREVRGKNPALTPQIINDSVNQTLSRTVLASLTVFLVAGVLYFFGGAGVHLFAFVMVVGVLVGTYSSIFVASPLLLMLGEGHTADPAARTPAKAEEAAV